MGRVRKCRVRFKRGCPSEENNRPTIAAVSELLCWFCAGVMIHKSADFIYHNNRLLDLLSHSGREIAIVVYTEDTVGRVGDRYYYNK